jgi:hypothetical protein
MSREKWNKMQIKNIIESLNQQTTKIENDNDIGTCAVDILIETTKKLELLLYNEQ